MMQTKVETVSLKQFSDEEKTFLLNELGYLTDGNFVLDKEGRVLKDKYTKETICLSNMIIMPGSTIILDNNELSITLYLQEYGDKFIF